jgi:N-carbamoylputrescine amidase
MTRVGLAQLGGEPDRPAVNRALSLAAAARAFAEGAEVVVLPELIVPGYTWNRGLLEAGAEPIDGATVTAWVSLAARTGGLIAGGFAEREGDRIFNTAVLVGPHGPVLHYRKLHLFSGEKDVLAPGDLGLPVVQTQVGVIALCVCYDLRFVETLRALSLSGAELVCVPTAWVVGFDAQRWDADGFCPQARGALLQANLDGVFVACASQVGRLGGHEFLGSSVVGDPRGQCIAGPLSPAHSDLALADLDLSMVGTTRNRGGGIHPREDRRTDVYALELDGVRL